MKVQRVRPIGDMAHRIEPVIGEHTPHAFG
jgi:hypothetical protein